MKKISILLLVFTLFIKVIYAQLPQVPTSGSYVTNNTMGAFIGNWRWVNGNDTLIIYLQQKKLHFSFNGGLDIDAIVGWHRYVQNGVVIENSAFKLGVPGMNIIMGGNQSDELSVLRCTLEDRSRGNKSENLMLTLTNNNTQLIWKLKENEWISVTTTTYTPPPYITGLTLPENLVLTKF